MNNAPIAIVGPTCSGKTALAMAIAARRRVEIVSADSRQFYRGMDIGTAKPTRAMREAVPHHFIDIAEPDERYSAGRYGEEAARTVSEILARGALPLIVGGSGLYVRALIDGLYDGPDADPAIRADLEARGAQEGLDALLDELRRVDPDAITAMRTPTMRRVVRALEVYRATGTPITVWRTRRIERPFTVRQIALNWNRGVLYARINARVDEMMQEGLLEEVRALASRGYDERINALNSPGYAELFPVLRGEQTLERAIELIKQHTRNYAKRQLTWFRADERVEWIEVREPMEWMEIAAAL